VEEIGYKVSKFQSFKVKGKNKSKSKGRSKGKNKGKGKARARQGQGKGKARADPLGLRGVASQVIAAKNTARSWGTRPRLRFGLCWDSSQSLTLQEQKPQSKIKTKVKGPTSAKRRQKWGTKNTAKAGGAAAGAKSECG